MLLDLSEAPELSVDVIHLFGNTSENFPRTKSSTSWLARTTIGNVSRRLNGLQASITTRALRGSSLAYAIGSSAVDQQPRKVSMPSRGSKRVHIAHTTLSMSAGSMSSSTTTTKRLA